MGTCLNNSVRTIMYRKVSFVLCVLLAARTSHGTTIQRPSCDPLRNVKATIYTGSPKDPQVVTLYGQEDLRDAYKVEIDGQNILELCEDGFNGINDPDTLLNGLNNLDTLTITNSNIKTIKPGAFNGVTNLRMLDLTHNQIAHIPHGVFNKLNIRRVNLTSNEIANIDSTAFDDMPKLQVVELGDNKLTKFDSEMFANSPMVYRIIMDHNNIKVLPKDALKNLAESTRRPHAIHLWLSHNQIEDIHPLAFRNIEDIESLWLDHNKLTEIDDETFKDIKLDTLTLDRNQLGCFSDAFLGNLSVKDFNVDMNPLECDCLRRLKKWSAKKNIEIWAVRRGLECLRDTIDKAFKSQKKYYEDQLEMERRF